MSEILNRKKNTEFNFKYNFVTLLLEMKITCLFNQVLIDVTCKVVPAIPSGHH